MNNKSMKIILASVALTSISCMTYAADVSKNIEVSGNVGVYSDYLFRGYTQTDSKPAIQGGFDVNHSSGLYIGTWESNVAWTTQPPGDGVSRNNSIEMDVYGGFAKTIKSIDADIGVLTYYYPGRDTTGATSANSTEGYVKVSKDFGRLTAGASVYLTLTNENWAFADSSGSQYYSGDIDIPVGKTPATVSLHVGNQQFTGTGNSDFDYTDWKVNLDYSINDTYSVGAFYTGTNQDKAVWTVTDSVTSKSNFLGGDTGGAYLSASF